MGLRTLLLLAAVSVSWIPDPAGPTTAEAQPPPKTVAAAESDYFQYPLSKWDPHCLGFGSEWRLCDGTVLRACPSGAIWRHTGVDVKSDIQPVMAAADGVIAGYIVDPTFRGGILIRHPTSEGVVLTQYWHVWPRPDFRVGTRVTRGQEFADIADMGARTHLHFAVFQGDYVADAWRGALPPTPCVAGFPAFPNRFVEPNGFIQAHLQPPQVRGPHCRLGPDDQ